MFSCVPKKKSMLGSHPCLHCGLFDNVLQPLLMVPGRFGSSALFFILFLHHTHRADYKYIRVLTHKLHNLPGRTCCTFDVSPLQGFAAASVARLVSSSPAPSLCWWFVWPDRSAGGVEAGLDTSPPPQLAYKQTHTHKISKWLRKKQCNRYFKHNLQQQTDGGDCC